MKSERKSKLKTMAEAIENDPVSISKPVPSFTPAPGEISSDIKRKKLQSPDEILATKKLEIPVCKLQPINGRIFVIDIIGDDMKTPGGLILPPRFGVKKNDQVEGVRRYFVVDWDKVGIPPEIQDLLSVGVEVNPFLPEHAVEWDLPRVIVWAGNNIFKVIHYTELAGISSAKPIAVEK